jgi:excisionase family DNA binding protein
MPRRTPTPSDTPLLLLTREQVATRCQVSLNTVDEWTWREGFPVIRRGGHFVRIHAAKLDEWLAQEALGETSG